MGKDVTLPYVGHLYCNTISNLYSQICTNWSLWQEVMQWEKLLPKPGINSHGGCLIWEALCGCDHVVPSASCVLQNPMSPRCVTSPRSHCPWLQLGYGLHCRVPLPEGWAFQGGTLPLGKPLCVLAGMLEV